MAFSNFNIKIKTMRKTPGLYLNFIMLLTFNFKGYQFIKYKKTVGFVLPTAILLNCLIL